MIQTVSNLNATLSLLTLGGQILIFVLVLLLLFKKESPIIRFFEKHALLCAFLVALGGTVISLFYSEVAGFDPCKLCWYQRIFMYPQVVLLGIALWEKDYSVAKYSLTLSLVGGMIAFYHYYGQMFNPSALPCEVIGLTPACSQRFFVEFGYITIPMMALTGFVLILVLMALVKKQGTENFPSE